MRFLLAVLVGIACLQAATQPSRAETRVALVVGNAGYTNVPPLANSANDARLIAETLRGLGFVLVGGGPQLDLDKAAFDQKVQLFGSQLQGADVGLFYYAGHGVQVRGTNYLVPISANLTREAEVDFQMLDTNLVLRQMESSGTKLNLVILDACRNNPFGATSTRSASRGLAQMQAPEGTLISFATQPGSVAQDGDSGNSPFTRALSQTIRRPGLGIFEAFNEVGLAVMQSTGNAQQPWVSSSPIRGNFHFSEPAAAPPAQVAALPAQAAVPSPPTAPSLPADELFWLTIRDSKVPALFSEFTRKFPNSPHVGDAQAHHDQLEKLAALEQDHDVSHRSSGPGVSSGPNLASLVGVYSGSVARTNLKTHRKDETRVYQVTLDPDAKGGKLVIKGRNFTWEMSFVGQMTDNQTFVGKTRPTVAGTSANYIPDNITLRFAPDNKSLQWHHEDGRMEGSGTLSRS
jgi:uncharacterized caspase-like protein